ncbi:MAG: CHASE3 domain-containing protein [Thermomicrobiales bacterium]
MTDVTADRRCSSGSIRTRAPPRHRGVDGCWCWWRAAASLFLVRTVDSQLADIAQTYEVRRQARELMLALVDAETGQRGYLLTQDQSLSRALQPGGRHHGGNLPETRCDVIRDNPSQRLRIEGMAARDHWPSGQELAQHHRTDVGAAMSTMRWPSPVPVRARRSWTAIRDTLRSFIAEEDARLVERNAQMAGYRQGLVRGHRRRPRGGGRPCLCAVRRAPSGRSRRSPQQRDRAGRH